MPEAGEGLSIAWIGHSTVLVEVDGVRLLTDPLLRRRIGHLLRVAAPPEDGAAEVDAVLVSHVHHDHLDLRSLERVRTALKYVEPNNLWLAPDCGLMTISRDLANAKAKLLVDVAKEVRRTI